MRGVNKVILLGNLGRDPEVRYMPSGGAVANITVATSEAWKDKATGAMQEQTEWHRVVFYGRLAEIVGKYLRKGSKVFIEGSLHTRKWQDKTTSQDKYATEIKAMAMQMLDGKGDGSDQGYAAQSMPEQHQADHRSSGPRPSAPDFDDDIPF